MEERPLYTLNELIEQLEDIRNDKRGVLNYTRAFLTLAYEIKRITDLDKKEINPSEN